MMHLCLSAERVILDGLYYEMTQFSPSATVKLYGEGEMLLSNSRSRFH